MIPNEFRNAAGERLDTAFHPGSRPGRLVILAHGVTGNKDRAHLVTLAEGLSAEGWPCLRISFSGNGLSEGRFAESTLSKEVRDVRSVIAALPPETKIAYVGHSMGGAVGTLAAAVEPRIRVLVSLAGMVHTAAFVKREFAGVEAGRGFMWDKPECPLSQVFLEQMLHPGSTLGAARLIRAPWLFIHGQADDLVPVEDSSEAFAVASVPRNLVLIQEAGHSFEGHHAALVEACSQWLDTHLA